MDDEKSLKDLVTEHMKISDYLWISQHNRLERIKSLEEIMSAIAGFWPYNHKFHNNGYYFFLDFTSLEKDIIKRITVQKKWQNINLLTTSEEEFEITLKIIEQELRRLLENKIKEDNKTAEGMK